MTAAYFEDHPADPEKMIMRKPRLDQGPDYERGFVDGMQYQMHSSVDKAVNRMAQPEQEPVAWGVFDGPNLHDVNFTEEEAQEMVRLKGDGSVVKPLYTTPPQPERHGMLPPLYTTPPQRKPLTHPQIHEFDWPDGVSFDDILSFVRAIEAAHGIKENT